MDIYSQHNDPSIWSNPLEFDISRWLGPNRESNKSKLLSFGLGPTSCVGRELAWMEIYLVLAELIRNFELELVDRELTHNLQFLNKPLEKRLRVKISKSA
jgi:cytochrome P450